MQDVDSGLDLFLTGFTARDLARPLPSCDETSTAAVLRETMESHAVDIVGIRRSGITAGWVARTDLRDSRGPLKFRPFEDSRVVSDRASLDAVVQALNGTECAFVQTLGEVNGIIRRSDLQKPAMRMWLFGLVTISELRVTSLIDEHLPRNAWQKYLSPGRLQKSRDLQDERRRHGQSPSLLECLQFADKGDIVSRDETLRRLTRFESRRDVERFVKALQKLRNNLAHSQDLSGDWDVILELALNLHRIVLGPQAQRVDNKGPSP